MSNNLVKAFVVVLFAVGIFAFVFYKSNKNQENASETEQVMDADTEESSQEEEAENIQDKEKVESTTDKKVDPPATNSNPQKIKNTYKEIDPIDQLVIPSSKSAIPINVDDIRHTVGKDSSHKDK